MSQLHLVTERSQEGSSPCLIHRVTTDNNFAFCFQQNFLAFGKEQRLVIYY